MPPVQALTCDLADVSMRHTKGPLGTVTKCAYSLPHGACRNYFAHIVIQAIAAIFKAYYQSSANQFPPQPRVSASAFLAGAFFLSKTRTLYRRVLNACLYAGLWCRVVTSAKALGPASPRATAIVNCLPTGYLPPHTRTHPSLYTSRYNGSYVSAHCPGPQPASAQERAAAGVHPTRCELKHPSTTWQCLYACVSRGSRTCQPIMCRYVVKQG